MFWKWPGTVQPNCQPVDVASAVHVNVCVPVENTGTPGTPSVVPAVSLSGGPRYKS